MIRCAFTMRLKPGALEEYRRHHDEVWPGLVAEIEKSGIASMTIFHDGDRLFLFSEIRDPEAWDRLWRSEVHQEWARVMEPLMHLKPDMTVDSGQLEEIFHVETDAGDGDAIR